MKKLFYLLFPQWKVVEVIQGHWIIGNYVHSYVTYEILYSKRLFKYKLRCSGTDWKKHPTYQEAIKKLNFFNEY